MTRAEDHHDVFVMDTAGAGARLVSRRLPEGLPGISGLHPLLAGHVNQPDEVVRAENLVHASQATGRYS